MKYSYIENKLAKLKKKVDYCIYGKSFLNQELCVFHLGDYDCPQIILEAGIHSREYIATLFLLKEIEYLKDKTSTGLGYYIFPLLNPDGVRLCIDGIGFVKNKLIRHNLYLLNRSNKFNLWKANVRGVDLNVNFNALWGRGAKNIKQFSSANFIGLYPQSEVENKAIINFIKPLNIVASLSFHSKGEVVYYGFEMDGNRLEKEKMLALEICKINKYKAEKTQNSTGGFSDYMSLKDRIYSYTIELGNDNIEHPLKHKHLNEIFQKNKDVPLVFEKYLCL